MKEYAELENFIRKHYAALYTSALKFVKSEAVAQDIVQEIIIRYWENQEKYNTIESIENFLFVSVKNEALNYLRIIYDDVGSWSLSKEFIRELRKSDIQIYPFLPVRFHHLANKANYRNHRKIAVVDGEVGFVGGLNIADRYMDGVPGIGIWRDTHLKVTGEVVTSLQVIFLIDWYFVRQELSLERLEKAVKGFKF